MPDTRFGVVSELNRIGTGFADYRPYLCHRHRKEHAMWRCIRSEWRRLRSIQWRAVEVEIPSGRIIRILRRSEDHR